MNESQKYENLKKYIDSLGSLAVAFSGGVDSTFLLKTAAEILGDKAIAVTARSASFPKRELDEAINFCQQEHIRHILCDSEELNIEGFSQNPVNRCYLCKNELFSKIRKIAADNQIENVAEGSNIDDNGDFRPGLKAVEEQGIKSPLRYAGLTKNEIRSLSKKLGLSTWNKQSFACLSSRFPYGQEISPSKLAMVDKAEQLLLDMGLKQTRVRHHGDLARIETDENGFALLAGSFEKRKTLHEKFKEFGWTYVSIDILGYRTGSMNEPLKLK
ncbi:MAG: ATP-dependent sacrificial sulfur transferase LarE [Elusimicrobiota bacterium]|jgi:uncharacterized protein|nr:ATP-dependent sacrificial sulfur transferase LarE [Elusimicrobiota bacterium]